MAIARSPFVSRLSRLWGRGAPSTPRVERKGFPRGWTRAAAFVCAAAFAVGPSAWAAAQTSPATTDQAGAETAPALVWRFIDGQGVVGVLRLSAAARTTDGPIGFFVLRVAERGLFEGIYNLKEDGRAIVGVFWAEGELNGDVAAGFLDVALQEDGSGAGALSFTAGGSIDVLAR